MNCALHIPLPDGLLAVEPIAELEVLEAEATAAELSSVEGITARSRRAERLAWRRLLRRVAGEWCKISYNEQGAPCISNSQYRHISVSHCADCVALLLSDKPCGVDIERTERNFERVAAKYITAAEREGLQVDSPLKIQRDMEILELDIEEGELRARLLGERIVDMRIVQPDSEHILVFG